MNHQNHEPIAVIGMGCKFPGGANSLDEFWDLLIEGRDGITETPEDRWDREALYHPDYTHHGKINVKWGGFMDNIDLFDNKFFSIPPMEAKRMDPQQRLLLETTYKAFEDAGLNTDELAGSQMAVYLGISAHDYGDMAMTPSERVFIDGKTISGGSASIAANRISYVFDLKGPSLSIDTACSSSLNACHIACNAIWNEECDTAIVAGVNSLIKPEATISFSTGGFLSPDGRCKTFDSRANGYIRSEGVGVLILKPLSQAINDGDKIYTTIVGTLSNQDGLSDGISMPNQEAQQAILSQTYKRSGIDPASIQYIEAHGTGTKVGDPIEANAIGLVIGRKKKDGDKLIIGSAKSNIGHLEPASGVAGLIKLSLSMKNKMIPPNVHFKKPNPKIKFKEYNLMVPQTLMDWPESKDGMYGGVNSFGFGGSNAHAILKGYTDKTQKISLKEKDAELFTLSARSPEALKQYATDYLDYIKTTKDSLPDICYTANVRRSHHALRATFAITSKKDLAEKLDIYLKGETRIGLSSGRATQFEERPKLAFVCSGQGPQWWGMARELMKSEPVFLETVDSCDAIIKTLTQEWSLKEEMMRDEKASRINETRIAQPALFAVQVGLFRVWESWGIKADAVVGHSIGEVAAAYISGMISFEEAVKIIFHRSRVQDMASGKGKMLAVGLPEKEAAALIVGEEDKVSVATINGPTLVTLSGSEDVLQKIADDLDKKDIFYRFLVVEVPFHSPYMEPLKDDLITALSGTKFSKKTMPLYSTVTGKEFTGNYDGEYWYKNVRNSVRFTDAIDSMIADGITAYIELAPHPILLRYLGEMLEANNKKGISVGSLDRKNNDLIFMRGSLGKLYTWGMDIDWRTFQEKGNIVEVPPYPFQRESFWIETEESRKIRIGKPQHPFIKKHADSARDNNDHIWDIVIDKRVEPFIEDHRVQGPLVFPGAGSCETTIACALDAFGSDFNFIEDINFKRAVFLPDEGQPPEIQLNVTKDNGDFSIYSRMKESDPWDKHIWGKIKHHQEKFIHKEVNLDDIKARVTETMDMAPLYDELFECGLQLGPTFRGIDKIYRNDTEDGLGESYGKIETPTSIIPGIDEFNIHPAILDASFQCLFGAPTREEGKQVGVMIPVHIDRFKFYKSPSKTLYSYGRGTEKSQMYMSGDIWIFDENGDLCIEIQGFKCRFLEGTRGEDDLKIDNTFYKWEWQINELPNRQLVRQTETFLPKPSSIKKGMESVIKEVQSRPDADIYNNEFEELLDKITVHYIEKAFKDLGVSFKKGDKIDPTKFCEEKKVVETHHKLVPHCLGIIAKTGILSGSPDKGYTIERSPEEIDIEAFYDELWTKYPMFQHELKMLHRCGPFLAKIFTGEEDAVKLLFPESEWDAIVDYYQQSYSFKKYNDIIKGAMQLLTKKLPKDQTLRILEIGAGTGGVSSAIFPILPADRTTYTYTDISYMFMVQAERMYGTKFPFIEFKTLDISKPLEDQGYRNHTYDIVIASDVLHATKSIKYNLENVKKLLAPNGILCMLEVTGCPFYTDLVFGLTEGWWMFEDYDLRPTHPSLSKAKWLKVFKDLNFAEVLPLSDIEKTDVASQTVFLAQNTDAKIKPLPLTLPERYEGKNGLMVLLKDQHGVGDYVAKEFEAIGEECISVIPSPGKTFSANGNTIEIDPASPEDMEKLFTNLKARDKDINGITHFWNINYPNFEELSLEKIDNSYYEGCTSIVNLVNQLYAEGDPGKKLWFWIVTSNAMNVAHYGELALTQSSAWGLARGLLHEHQNLNATIIDLGADLTELDKKNLVEQMLMDEEGEEVAIRENIRYFHKFINVTPESEYHASMKMVKGYDSPYNLVSNELGVLDNLHYREIIEAKLKDDEVRIEPRATGLNFKDVMIAMGLLDDEAPKGGYTGYTFGMECAGVITEVGKKVKTLKAGDEVMAISADSFASQVITKGSFCYKKPSKMGFAEAATIPFAYITAYYSIGYLARMKKGDRVLIHSASGGVGTAAVRIAQAVGAEIYATAGSKERRAFVKSLGVKNVYDSRSLTFADEIMEDTDGKGVNIVLNAIAGSAIHKSISILDHYGCFVEIGKTDIYNNNTISLRDFSRNLSYFAVDIDKLLTQKPELCGELVKECMGLFKNNCPEPHSFTEFTADKVVDAFNFMAATRHIGKVVVTRDQETLVEVAPSDDITTVINDKSTYLITGGFSGLGLEVAQWLVDCGAKSLAIVSRSGAKTDEAKSVVAKLRKQGIDVLEGKADAANPNQMKAIFDQIAKKMKPLKGIVHSAMVLDDCLFKDMAHERFMTAVRPKVLGAVNMHKLSKNLELDFFVNYSSISGQYGTPGQSNYAAANVFLDMLSCHRQQQGLTGSTISWGVIGKIGFVSRDEKVSDILLSQGWTLFMPEQVKETMAHMILRGYDHRGAFEVDWPSIAQYYQKDKTSHRFAHLLIEDENAAGAGDGSLKDSLFALPEEERHATLQAEVADRIARILGTSVAKMDMEEPISNMGLDSLMANQLRNWIQLKIGVDFSMMKIMRGPSMIELTKQLLADLGDAPEAGAENGVDNRSDLEKWFGKTGSKPEAKVRLFCFPYMGGGASSFGQWNSALPGNIEAVPVHLPGREDRLEEESFNDIDELTQTLCETMLPVLDKPFALYGHSIGAAMVYKTAALLESKYGKTPEHIFLAGWMGPEVKSPFKIIANVTPEEIMAESGIPTIFEHMRSLEIPESVLENKQLMDDMLPSVRADIIMGLKLEKAGIKGKMNTPMTAFAGKNDTVFSVEQVKAWEKMSDNFDFHEVDGGHLFMRESRARIFDVITDKLN